MSLYISTTFAKDKTPVTKVLETLIKKKIYNIELGSNHIWQENILKKIKKYDHNFLVHNYFPVPKKNLIVNIASQDKQIRKKNINHIKNSIQFCKRIKSKLYTFHPGFILDPVSQNKSKKNYDFIFNKNDKHKANYEICFNNMVSSLKNIVEYAKKNKVRIAIETEGSRKKSFSFLYHYKEYQKLYTIFKTSDFGLSLNIGHLNLASKSLNFNKYKFVKILQKHIVAIEMSHNNGIYDEHKPLIKNAWYWKIINNKNLRKTYKIMEFRNTPINKILKTIKLYNEKKKKF